MKKILLIDDDPTVIDLVKNRLEANEYEVIAAYGGEEGLRMARQDRPDLIVLDVMMPEQSGYEVCAQLKLGDKALKIPVLMLSAKIGYINKKRAIQCGADAYVPKPYSSEMLLEEIESLLH